MLMKLVTLVTLVTMVTMVTLVTAAHTSDESRLIKQLLANYTPTSGRPVLRDKDTLDVYFRMILQQVLYIDEDKQMLMVSVWLHTMWKDVHFTWNASNFDNITEIYIDEHMIWKPDIYLYNAAERQNTPSKVRIEHTGTIFWFSSAILTTTCFMNVVHFPFDNQICHYHFGSWTYSASLLQMHRLGGFTSIFDEDHNHFIRNNEWEVKGNESRLVRQKYSCCEDPYSGIVYTIVIYRKSVFYKATLLIPCLIFSILAVVMFITPPDSSVKLLIGINTLLGLAILLLALQDVTPANADSMPIIAIYYCISLIFVALSLICAVFVVKIEAHDRRSGRLPSWLRKMFLDQLSKLLWVQVSQYRVPDEAGHAQPNRADPRFQTPNAKSHDAVNFGDTGKMTIARTIAAPSPSQGLGATIAAAVADGASHPQHELFHFGRKSGRGTRGNVVPTKPATPDNSTSSNGEISEIRTLLRQVVGFLQAKRKEEALHREWHAMALVLDRLLAFVFVTVNLLLSTVAFWQITSQQLPG